MGYNMMAVRLMSKWDVRRLARATGATALPKMTPPTSEEMGMADTVYIDDIERAVDDGVNVFKGLCKDGKMTAGGGATEIELARQVAQWAETHPGLEQYSINKFAEG